MFKYNKFYKGAKSKSEIKKCFPILMHRWDKTNLYAEIKKKLFKTTSYYYLSPKDIDISAICSVNDDMTNQTLVGTY